MNYAQFLAAFIFLGAYVLIAIEVFDKTRVALAGATLMLVLRLVEQHTAFHGTHEVPGVDWNTIFLLIGMMIVVGVTRHTGLFQWIAIRSAKLVHGHPVGIVLALSVITAVVSAFLDNVTTVLLVAPVVFVIARALETDPVPFIIPVSLASNIGGTATLIGHPPNIMIASAAGFTFADFLRYDTPPTAVILLFFCLMVWAGLSPRTKVSSQARARIMAFDEKEAIRDPVLLRKCLFVIGLALLGFVVHGRLRLEPATIALAAAALLLLLLGRRPRVGDEEGEYHWYHEVEWGVIFFFVGLFVMVAGLVELGVVKLLGQWLVQVTGGNTVALTFLILWFSAFAAGMMDNIPFVATMNALILGLQRMVAGPDPAGARDPLIMPLWWALSLGACLGANFTAIGSATNIVSVSLAARDGHPVSFARFLKYGVPVTLMSIVVAMAYLWLVFLRHLPPGASLLGAGTR